MAIGVPIAAAALFDTMLVMSPERVASILTSGRTDEEIAKKLATAMTDPARKRRDDPGNPDICNIFSYHKIFSTPEELLRSILAR